MCINRFLASSRSFSNSPQRGQSGIWWFLTDNSMELFQHNHRVPSTTFSTHNGRIDCAAVGNSMVDYVSPTNTSRTLYFQEWIAVPKYPFPFISVQKNTIEVRHLLLLSYGDSSDTPGYSPCPQPDAR